MSDRIQRLASYVRPHSVLYDLCCDHGYIGLAAWDQKPLAGLILVDQSAHALRAVQQELSRRGLTGDGRVQAIALAAENLLIDTRPSDFIMAGVGTKTIVTIMQNLFPKGLGPHRLILSPEKNSNDLRRYLRDRGMGLVTDDVVMDGRRFREIIVIEAKGIAIPCMGEGFADRDDETVRNFIAALRIWRESVAQGRALTRQP